MDSLRGILADLLNPEKAAESTKQMKVFKSDPQLLPSLMNIALSDGEPAIRQMAAVILRKETSKRFSGLNQADQAQLKEAIIKGIGRNALDYAHNNSVLNGNFSINK